MNELSQRIASLTPAQRSLLEQRLRQQRSAAIPRSASAPSYPLSFSQERLWFLQQLEPESALYNQAASVRFQGRLQVEILERSLAEVLRRHQVLRSRLQQIEGQPRQTIAPWEPLKLPLLDLRSHPEADREAEVQRLALAIAQQPFDLSRDPLLRTQLLKLDAETHVLLVALHHSISDGWSKGILIREVAALYQAFAQGLPSPLPTLPIQYTDFAVWQRQQLQGEVLNRHLSYWKQQLRGPLPVLELPTDRPRPPVQTFRGAQQSFQPSQTLSQALKRLSQEQGVTLFMVLLAAFKTLLHRYSSQTDLCVGSPIANRNRAEVEPLNGCFINTLVLRTDLSGNPSFRDLLRQVQTVTLEAYTHQDLPFEKLVEELQPERNLSYSPLFQVMFALQNVPRADLSLPDVTLEVQELHSGTAKFDLTLAMEETEQGLIGTLEYNSDLFEPQTIRRMIGHFQTLLQSIQSNPDQPLATLPLLTPAEQQLLVKWNQTQADFPLEQTIHDLFEEQAARTPNQTAVVYEGQSLTYGELNARADQLAHYLQQQGVGPEVIVGLCLERSLEMVVGLLGILKAGGAYLPLDPSYPSERLAFMLADSQAPILLSQASLLPHLPQHPAQIICLDTDWPTIQDYSPIQNLKSKIENPQSLAYVIYTSGSTGKPKGVMIEHRSVVNFLCSLQEQLQVTPQDKLLAVTTLSFDIAALELFLPLVTGAQVVLVSRAVATDGRQLIEVLQQSQATWMQATPATWRLLLLAGWQGQPGLKALCGGEALPRELAQALLSKGQELWNLYGPTEATIWSTLWPVPPNAERILIGRPIANTQVYLLDAALQPVPVGVPGELYIGGAGLARGYLNRPDLTAERFIDWDLPILDWRLQHENQPNPKSKIENRKSIRLYRTGDLGRYLPDGNLECLGRIDHQVKLRGYRIELGEIETLLHQHPDVQAAAVLVREDQPGDQRLVAYVVPAAEVDPGSLRTFLQQKLPAYMLPSAFVVLEALPLTPNGKLDRRALPPPQPSGAESSVAPPLTPVEQQLAQIWQQVLNLPQVERDSNFFELGGHSLLATQVMARIQEAFEVQLPLRSLFEAPTLASLAVQVTDAGATASGATMPAVQPVARDEPLPLSFGQQRLWFLQQLEPDSPLYNGAGLVQLRGQLHPRALEQSLQEIVRRHETLRTRFVIVKGELVQQIEPQMTVALPIVDLSTLAEPEQSQQVQALALEVAQQPFDLTTGPLLRASLLHLSETEHCLLLNLHHIVSDAWSIGVLVRELAALYPAFIQGQPSPLPDLPVQYADYAVWQRQWLQGEVLQTQLDYWKQQLGNLPPALVFPSEARENQSASAHAGRKYAFTLSAVLTAALKQLSQEQGVTLFMTLLAAFNLLLFDLTGAPDLLIGSPIANRNRRELEGLIGFFVNTLVLRADLSGDPSFTELLQRVKLVALGAYAHQDLPFEQLVSELQPDRALTQAPFFRVWFVLQNAPMPPLELPGLTLKLTDVETGWVRHDLKLDLTEMGDQLSGFFEYKTAVFDADAIARLQVRFEQLLHQVTAHPDLTLSQVQERLDQAQATAFQASQRQRLSRLSRRPSQSL